MRLKKDQIVAIKQLARQVFGAGTSVYLFGSRTDDSLKGGDIDLFVKNADKEKLNLLAKVHFLARLKAKIGDRKIDVVLDNELSRKKESFYRAITGNALEL